MARKLVVPRLTRREREALKKTNLVRFFENMALLVDGYPRNESKVMRECGPLLAFVQYMIDAGSSYLMPQAFYPVVFSKMFERIYHFESSGYPIASNEKKKLAQLIVKIDNLRKELGHDDTYVTTHVVCVLIANVVAVHKFV